MKFECTIKDQVIEVDINSDDSTYTSTSGSGNYEFSFENGRYMLRLGTKLYKIDNVNYNGTEVEFTVDGTWVTVDVKDEQAILLDKLGFKSADSSAEGILKSPMPGKILEIIVNEGDEVEKGARLAILEAMKMENELKAPISGTITKIHVETGVSVEKGTPLLEIENIG